MSQAIAIEESENHLQARSQSACFVCGQDNPHGLRLPFQRQDSGEMTATWTPDPAWEGFRGIVHGGVVSTVLDEAMSKAVAATGSQALTAELRVRFHRRVASGGVFLVRGWIVKRNRRLIEAEAALTAPDGTGSRGPSIPRALWRPRRNPVAEQSLLLRVANPPAWRPYAGPLSASPIADV
jgi:acyl-coenzyme A thioesterase PaaI-like protein